MLSGLRGRRVSTSPASADAYTINEPIEEELLPGDRLKYFYPARPGEILDGRFKTITKLGKWWRKSTIPRYVSIKIPALDVSTAWEAKLSRIIAIADPTHDGLQFIRTSIDNFQLERPEGTHSCLVYESMRETLYFLQHTLRGKRLAPPLFRWFLYCLLEGIDYLHTKCGIIHTDIKNNNILVTIKDNAVLTKFVKFHEKNPQPGHINPEDGRTVYLSQPDFGPVQGSKVLPKLGDFDLAVPKLAEGIGYLSAIQSHRFRAPEVLLGLPWYPSVDIWNLGVLMWNLLEDVSLFERPAGEDGEYDAHVHLAQLVSLLGDPPEELIKREKFFRNNQLEKPVKNKHGKECKTMNEFWGGPFFDDANQIYRKDLVGGEKLASRLTVMDGDEKATFLDFASGMINWLPENRKSARELLQHPYFDSFNESRARWEKGMPGLVVHV